MLLVDDLSDISLAGTRYSWEACNTNILTLSNSSYESLDAKSYEPRKEAPWTSFYQNFLLHISWVHSTLLGTSLIEGFSITFPMVAILHQSNVVWHRFDHGQVCNPIFLHLAKFAKCLDCFLHWFGDNSLILGLILVHE